MSEKKTRQIIMRTIAFYLVIIVNTTINLVSKDKLLLMISNQSVLIITLFFLVFLISDLISIQKS